MADKKLTPEEEKGLRRRSKLHSETALPGSEKNQKIRNGKYMKRNPAPTSPIAAVYAGTSREKAKK